VAAVRLLIASLLLVAASSCASAPTVTPSVTTFSGLVMSGTKQVVGATVTLYTTGSSGLGSGAPALATGTTDASGRFTIANVRPSASTPLYAVAVGGNAGGGTNAAAALIAVQSASAAGQPITINEFSTVAAAYAFAQFSDATGQMLGASATNATGIVNAANLLQTNLVNASGAPAAFWPSAAICTAASLMGNCEGLQRMNTLANILAACVQSAGPSSTACSNLLGLTGNPATTLGAVHAIATNPGRNAAALFALASQNSSYGPIVPAAPDAWTLALRYVGNGNEFDGPGQLAIDRSGNVYATDNYLYNGNPLVSTCGGNLLYELTPTGADAPGAPFSGGGLSGAGWGVTLDLSGNVWVANYGWTGTGCATPPLANSVSEFGAGGIAMSPASGFTQGTLNQPQGLNVDQAGNIWIADFGSNSVTKYAVANPSASTNFSNIGLNQPFAVAVDGAGHIWIDSEGNNALIELGTNGTPIAGSPFTGGGINRPLGVAIDSANNVWLANNGGNSISMVTPSGAPGSGSPYTGGGLNLPWGIAVDGNDNVWVANFAPSPSLSVFCGATARRCPAGVAAFGPISPSTGYTSGLLQRLVGVAVDASGNVWVSNNWLPIPPQTNPGGNGLVEFVGIAGPVKTPAVGPPQQP
jgi:hypothetical protein